MNEKKFVLGIVALIIISVIISVIVGVSSYEDDEEFLVANFNIDEEEALKTKEVYDTQEKKKEFIETASYISSTICSKLLDGSISNEQQLSQAIDSYNQILSTSSWQYLDMDKPKGWLGTWYLDNKGFLRFKFLTKVIEPSWINDEDVSDYIVLN